MQFAATFIQFAANSLKFKPSQWKFGLEIKSNDTDLTKNLNLKT